VDGIQFVSIKNKRHPHQVLGLRSFFTLCIAALTVSSCAGGATGQFPRLSNSPDAAHIVVLRRTWIVPFHRFRVSLDYNEIADLGPGEYVVFNVSPGEHFLGEINGFGHTYVFENGKRYFYAVDSHTHFLFMSGYSSLYLTSADEDQSAIQITNLKDVSNTPYAPINSVR
jgi:hypothetical protein